MWLGPFIAGWLAHKTLSSEGKQGKQLNETISDVPGPQGPLKLVGNQGCIGNQGLIGYQGCIDPDSD